MSFVASNVGDESAIPSTVIGSSFKLQLVPNIGAELVVMLPNAIFKPENQITLEKGSLAKATQILPLVAFALEQNNAALNHSFGMAYFFFHNLKARCLEGSVQQQISS